MTVQHPEDLRLAKALVGGNEAAFKQFFDAYFPRLYRFAQSRVSNRPELCEEVTLRALHQAVRKAHTFRGEASLFTWLCQICRRDLAASVDREHRRERTVTLMDDHPEVRAMLESMESTADLTPDLEVSRAENAMLVHTVLDHLPSQYGNVLEWKYAEGASVVEIATRLGTTPIAVQSMLARARSAFRENYSALQSLLGEIAPKEDG